MENAVFNLFFATLRLYNRVSSSETVTLQDCSALTLAQQH